MGKFLLALVLLLALGLSFPASRSMIAERARPLMTPAYRWLTTEEMDQMVEDLEFHQETRGPLPFGRGEFDAWMADRYPQQRSRVDAWGAPYRLEVTRDGFAVVSAGADGEVGTDDDLRRSGRRISGR